MDNRLEKILEVKVDVGDAIKGIDRLNQAVAEQKKQQGELIEKIKKLQEAEGDNTEAINQAREAYILSQQKVKDYNAQIASLSKTVQNQLKIDRENIGSMAQMRAALSNLTKEYDALSAEEREAAKGMELKDKINAVTDALKGSEEATQRYYRNVGNYENAIKNSLGLNSKLGQTLQNVAEATKNGVGPALKETTAGLKNVGVQLLKLLANPIVAILAAVSVAIMAVVKGIKSSEENMAKLKGITAAFKPVLDLITKGFQSFASVVLDVAGFLGRIVEGISKWLEKAPMIGDTIKAINEENERYKKLEEDKQKLVERNRKFIVDESAAELKVSELRVKAKEKEIYTDKERLAFVQEANEIERGIAEEKKAMAEERLRLLKEEAEATENTAEINDEIARAEAEVNRATIEYNAKRRELLEQENTIKREIAAADKARAAEKEAEDKKKLEDQEKYNKALEDATREAEDMFIELMEDGLKKEKAIENARFERQLQAIREKQSQYEKETEIYQQFALQIERATQLHNEALIDLENEYNAQYEDATKEREVTDEEYLEHKKRMAELEKNIESLKLREYSSIAGSISAILDATAGDNVKRIKAAKIAALGEIAINQGIAIAQAVTSVKGLVFPANVPAIAAAVANALAALVPAIQAVNSVKLARGGHVSGPGTSTSDSVPAMLSNGEFVVNARATSMFPELLETINNLGLGIAAPARAEQVQQIRQQTLSEQSLVKALKAMPAPVVSVEEINRTSNRVKTLENLTNF